MKDRKPTVLCVDDDCDVLEMLKIAIESGGYEVALASTAEEALKKYKAAKPDLIMVDLMMEEVDAGARFVTNLKALGNTAPVFMLSSIGDSLNGMTDYSDLGLSGIFQKPVDSKALLSTLKSKLEKK